MQLFTTKNGIEEEKPIDKTKAISENLWDLVASNERNSVGYEKVRITIPSPFLKVQEYSNIAGQNMTILIHIFPVFFFKKQKVHVKIAKNLCHLVM